MEFDTPLIVKDEIVEERQVKTPQTYRTVSMRMAAGEKIDTEKITAEKAENGGVRMRTMSLSNKPAVDPMILVNKAMEINKTPIKLSFDRLFFEVDVPVLDEEKLYDPSLRNATTKR
jgi:hypothetical protein